MTERHELEPLVHEWLHRTLDTIPEPTHRYGLVAAEVNETDQQRGWLAVPHPGRFSMFSALKFVAAAAIVALFGGFLLAGILTTPKSDEVLPAAVTDPPSPIATAEPAFPTGTFVADEDGLTLEFRADGTCQRAGVPCAYGVTKNLFSEMTFEDPSGEQLPGTYYWDFDGELLTFEPWGEDRRPDRQTTYAGHTFRPVGETLPLAAMDTDFPIGVFVTATRTDPPYLAFRENGTYTGHGWVGKYVVNGDLFTEMTHNSDVAAKVPATYHWRWDGERLSFNVWGEDPNPWRRSMLSDVYVRQPSATGDVRRLMLSHPQLDVWVTVEVKAQDGSYEATATVDEEPLGDGVGETLQEAVKAALATLGEPYASEIAASVKN